ncbi:glycosyltransferase family 4 protein [Sulfurovum sp.]|uniref:glycosyltransferase family 4 protein n=1 Tax=Sulfurovum sp. TaxID=1969726 RepID=UPI0028683717|nr:glycosyltransferase family 4 protein [Sulfurovum sp.]
MKICQILAGNEDGGLEKHTIELSHELQKEGLEITVIAHEKFANDFANIHFIPLDLSKGRNNLVILFKLYQIFKKEKFNIIHTQANKATAMVTKLKPFLASKIVSTLHNYKKNLRPFYYSDFVITVSDKIGEKLHIPNKITIYNGLNFHKRDSLYINLHQKYGIDQKKFVICTVARLTRVKRFDILLKALQGINVHLILVGGGEDEGSLKQLAKDIGIEDDVTFTGNLDNHEVQQIISSSKLFVMTSDNEGFPYTFVETMFCNTPFLSTPVSDIEKIIGKKYIVPFGDVEKISAQIAFIKNNYEEVLRDYQNIFSFSEEKFTLKNMTKETISVYEKVLR